MEHFNVFVYGTLMRGYHNHELLNSSDFVGYATTFDEHLMFLNTEYSIPYVVKGTDERLNKDSRNYLTHIHGEVYRVDERTLRFLDRLEGTPTYYFRETVSVDVTDGPNVRTLLPKMDCFMYCVSPVYKLGVITNVNLSGSYRLPQLVRFESEFK